MPRYAAVHVLPLLIMIGKALLERRVDGVPFPRRTGRKMFSELDVCIDDGRVHRVRKPPVE